MSRERFFIRKAVHSTLAFVLVLVANVFGFQTVLLLAGVLTAFFLLARMPRYARVIGLAHKASYGELFFIAGVGVTALIAAPDAIKEFSLAMMVLGIADPAAAIAGTQFGRHSYSVRGEMRTIEGSLACFLVCMFLLYIYGLPTLFIVVTALLLTAIEAVAVRGSDNIFLPVITILALHVL